MLTGLALPIGVGPNGGAKMVSGDEQDDKIIRLSLMDGDNENAFQQDICLGTSTIFDINDTVTKAKIIAKIRRIFQGFEREKRYRLREDSIRWISRDGETVLQFRYLNLETDNTKDFAMPMRQPAKTQDG